MRIRPTHDQALVKPRPDLHADLMGMPRDRELVDARGNRIRMGNVVSYKITSKHNQFAIAEVVALGEGTAKGSGRERPECSVGDTVGLDLSQVGHQVGTGDEARWLLPWKQLICRVLPSGPMPLLNWVMTEPDPIMMARLATGNSGTRLVVPASMATSGVVSSDQRKTRVKLCCEVVRGIGAGSWVGRAFVEPGCKVGDGACFTRGATIDSHLLGKRLSFTPWGEIVCVLSTD